MLGFILTLHNSLINMGAIGDDLKEEIKDIIEAIKGD